MTRAPKAPKRQQSPPQKGVLKKHVALVHIGNSMSLLQRRTFNVLLLQAYDDLLIKVEHRISVPVLCEMIGFDSRDTGKIKQALVAIRGQPIEFNVLGDKLEGEDWTATGLLSEATISKGWVIYSFGVKFAGFMHQPSIYAQINIPLQKEFESGYSLALYENCARFRKVGTTGVWSLETLRKLLGATAPLYDDFKELNRRVLVPAVKEVNSTADIQISLEIIRSKERGRPVIGVRFTVEEHPQRVLFPLDTPDDDLVRKHPAYRALRDIGLSDRLCLSAVSKDARWAQGIADDVTAKLKQGKIRSSTGALAAYMVKNEVPAGPSRAEEKAMRPKRRKDQASAQAEVDQRRAKLYRQYELERHKLAAARMDPQTQTELLRTWVKAETVNGRLAALRGYDPTNQSVKGISAELFRIFCTNYFLGDASEPDFERWLSERGSAA